MALILMKRPIIEFLIHSPSLRLPQVLLKNIIVYVTHSIFFLYQNEIIK